MRQQNYPLRQKLLKMLNGSLKPDGGTETFEYKNVDNDGMIFDTSAVTLTKLQDSSEYKLSPSFSVEQKLKMVLIPELRVKLQNISK